MAEVPGMLQVERFDERLFQFLQAIPSRGYSPHLLPFVSPVVILNNSSIAERDVVDERAFAAATATGPVVGERSFIAIVNPDGSPVRVYVDQVRASISVAHAIGEFMVIDTLRTNQWAGVGNPGLFNRMRKSAPINNAALSAAQLQVDTDAVLTTTPLARLQQATAMQTFEVWPRGLPIVLDPGRLVRVANNVVNVGINVSFTWREYPLASGDASVRADGRF